MAQPPSAAPGAPAREAEPAARDDRVEESSETATLARPPSNSQAQTTQPQTFGQRRRRRLTMRAFHSTDYMLDRADAEKLLEMVQGSLVLWPYDW